MIIYIILCSIITVLIILYILMYNKLKRLAIKVEEGSSGIDVALMIYYLKKLKQ